jgi:hypothetical protein
VLAIPHQNKFPVFDNSHDKCKRPTVTGLENNGTWEVLPYHVEYFYNLMQFEPGLNDVESNGKQVQTERLKVLQI